jgi:neutral ceramidase
MFLGLPAPSRAAEWKVGLASVKITPETPLRMAGYASRVKPFEDVEQDLFAKALAIEDSEGTRAILVTTDLIGLTAGICDEISARIQKELGLERGQILLTASHTHSGPALSFRVEPVPGGAVADAENTAAYTKKLIGQIADVAVQAAANLEPARLYWGSGVAHFAVNRREFTPRGVVLGVNPRGLADRTVPVLRVNGPDGAPRAVLFSYACHNTTLTGGNYSVCGDYSGFAQAHVEREFPTVQAMFMSGFGGDANPYPRGTMALAQKHGTDLGTEVARLMNEKLQEVKGPLNLTYDHALLPLKKSTREELEQIAAEGPSLHQGTARHLMARLDRGETLPEHHPAPVAVWQFGSDLTLAALPSEVVVDYAQMLEKALGPLQLWTVAYANDYFGYLPSPRVLEEGGYETRGLFSGNGWFIPETSEALVNKVRKLAEQAGRVLP